MPAVVSRHDSNLGHVSHSVFILKELTKLISHFIELFKPCFVNESLDFLFAPLKLIDRFSRRLVS